MRPVSDAVRGSGQLDGVLVLNKPSGPSSAQHIARVRRAFGQKKIGHAGTLDPLAGGILLVLLGQATKLSGYLMGRKIYSGCLKLGESTDTWDIQGRVLSRVSLDGISRDRVEEEIGAWTGISEQEVPSYSAAKHEGKPLYRLAREGVEVPKKTKKVQIEFAGMLDFEPPFVRFRVGCGSGTYIRSLAHSLGTRLGCGAVLCELTREYSHPFALAEAHELESLVADGNLAGRVVPIGRALAGHASLVLTEELARKARNGVFIPYGQLPLADERGKPEPFAPGREALFVRPDGEALCLAQTLWARGEPAWKVARGLWM